MNRKHLFIIFSLNEKKITGAIRENPMDVRYWSKYSKEKKIVLYCA